MKPLESLALRINEERMALPAAHFRTVDETKRHAGRNGGNLARHGPRPSTVALGHRIEELRAQHVEPAEVRQRLRINERQYGHALAVVRAAR